MKKMCLVIASMLMILSVLAIVSAEKLDVTTIKDSFLATESITLKASLLDSSNNPIDTNIVVTLEDAERRVMIQKTIPTNTLVDVALGDNAPAGYWKVTAKYVPSTGDPLISSVLFIVELSELAKFAIKDNVLTIINQGNTRYTKTIQIVIGETIGSKQLDLGPGESTSFRLIAPEGTYNIKVTDGKTTFTQSGVSLTGKVIGILDNRELSKGPLTTGVQGEESPYGDEGATSSFRSNSIVYIFLLVLFGAGILLAVERRFRTKALAEKPIVATK
jgi:hypothetical protein